MEQCVDKQGWKRMDPHGLVQGRMQDLNMGGQEKSCGDRGESCPLAENFTCNIASSVALQNYYRGMTIDGEVAWWALD